MKTPPIFCMSGRPDVAKSVIQLLWSKSAASKLGCVVLPNFCILALAAGVSRQNPTALTEVLRFGGSGSLLVISRDFTEMGVVQYCSC